MTRFALALTVLALPALAAADDIYRWRDNRGALHYSNQPAHVPSDADQLRTTWMGSEVVRGARMDEVPPTAPIAPSRPRRQEV